MKRVDLEGQSMFDFGDLLVLVPAALLPEPGADCSPVGSGVACGGFEPFTTRSGRSAARVLPGEGYLLRLYDGSGDRTWRGWMDRYPASPGCLAVAAATSRGGGCWLELTVTPASGYQTAEQVAAEADLA